MKRVITVTLFCAVALTACRTPGPTVNDSNKANRAKNCSATGKTLKTTSKEQKAADWAAIADCKAGQKKYDDAVEAYQKSLTLHRMGTQAQDVLNKCGLVLCQLKDYTAALACFKQVAEIPNPDKMQSRNMIMTSCQNMADAYEQHFHSAVEVVVPYEGECVYNIDMMEETGSVIAVGAGAISKRVFPDRDVARNYIQKRN